MTKYVIIRNCSGENSKQSYSNNQSRFHSNILLLSFFRPDSSGQVTSSPLGSPTSHRGMHPSLLSPTSMGPSGSLHSPISTLSSPMNGLASPFSVISSPMGPHSMNSPGMGYGPSVSPQVRLVTDSQMCSCTLLKVYLLRLHIQALCLQGYLLLQECWISLWEFLMVTTCGITINNIYFSSSVYTWELLMPDLFEFQLVSKYSPWITQFCKEASARSLMYITFVAIFFSYVSM